MLKKETKGESLEKRPGSEVERVHERTTVTPRVDIYENDKELLLLADVPGVEEKNLRIHLDQDQLTIEGSRVEESYGRPLAWEYRPAADYHRTFLVPQGIDPGKISAELRNGVLKLHLPKSEALRPRQIQIKGG